MRYSSAVAFRRALEERMKPRVGGDSARIARDRKRIAFDRMLARLVVAAPDAWVLKGGFALDLRLADRARTTKDVDLAWLSQEDELLDTLIDALALDLADYFTFSLEGADTSPDLMGGAHRFRVTASLAGRPFEAFVLDVGIQDAPGTNVELLTTPDLLAFAEIEPVTVPALPLANQVAEKLHAYTRVYEGGRASTRTKDLIDLASTPLIPSVAVASEGIRLSPPSTPRIRRVLRTYGLPCPAERAGRSDSLHNATISSRYATTASSARAVPAVEHAGRDPRTAPARPGRGPRAR